MYAFYYASLNELFSINLKEGGEMGNHTLITGGARSGKSRLAEEYAKDSSGKVVYIATAIPFDEGMKDRIKKHKLSRPDDWKTIEKFKDFKDLSKNPAFLECDIIILDCITLMVSNLMLESGLDFDNCSLEEVDSLETDIFKEIEGLLAVVDLHNKEITLVTNEVGMGLVPPYRLGNIFRDIAGRVNQYLAQEAQEVYFMVSGIPTKIK